MNAYIECLSRPSPSTFNLDSHKSRSIKHLRRLTLKSFNTTLRRSFRFLPIVVHRKKDLRHKSKYRCPNSSRSGRGQDEGHVAAAHVLPEPKREEPALLLVQGGI
ncbi:hypothetical protein M378DRAFT_170571 [Amanita muscaria Koide BX008]|uniref:Uncharacterized protein n=1 Tax=Amanita muscaria (strain Koide BX008) TaxID=946122 RepID=A0A0C2SWJ9_AMAMK|nr:hypothetical protein M378DRAFT_170571 [Amanita muscaria Koide BX008]